jgi:hypothetical protein
MAHYDPETLTILRTVLDEAWEILPDGSKSEAVRSDMAQRILKQAADGERDPVRLRASALTGIGKPANECKEVKRRSRIKQTGTFQERMLREARRLSVQANKMAPGRDRELLLRKARQAETAAHINDWLTSPGLASPK